MDDRAIRLKIVESLIAVAPRVEIQNPETLIEKAKKLEHYVTGNASRRKPGPKPKNWNNGDQQNQP